MENSLLFICIKLVTVSKKFGGQYWIIYKDNIYKKKDNILDIRDLILGPKLHSRSWLNQAWHTIRQWKL